MNLYESVRDNLKESMFLSNKYPDYNIKVPDDKLLLFHNTTQDNAKVISSEGLRANAGKERGRGIDGDFVWGTTKKNQKGYGGYTVAFVVDKEKAKSYKVNDTEYTLPFNIPVEDIVFIDEPIGLDEFRVSDIKDLVKEYGSVKVTEVLSKYTNLSSVAIDELLSKAINEEG